MTTPWRVALIGAGNISVYHLRAWAAVGAEVVAVCDIDRARALERAREFGVARVYEDAGALFEAGGFDVVDIAASVNAHGPLARQAADHGVHIMVQKPLCETVAEAEALLAYVGDRVRLMVHENYRFRPHYRTVRDWVREGRVGRPRHAVIACRGSGLCPRPGAKPYLLERQPYLAGFRRNLVLETMIHHLDVLRCLVGPLRVVAARLNRLADGLPGEDTASILMEGEGGLIATADGCICAPGYPALHGDRLEIVGSTGTLVMDMDRVFVVGEEDSAEKVDLLGRYQESFNGAMADFVAGLGMGAPFETEGYENLRTLRLVEDVYRAAGVGVDMGGLK